MDEESSSTGPSAENPPSMDLAPAPPAPMGWGFWAIMALIGVLILLIIYAQVQGITHPVTVNLTETNWTLTSYVSTGGTMVPATTGPKMNLSFGPSNESTLRGYTGCSWYSYVYSLNKTAFSLSNETLTPSSFDDPGMIQAESSYMDDLKNTTSVRFRGGRLTFYDVGGKPVLVFEQSVS